jgi:DNA-binding NarL/FixJ family response regulator
MMAATPKLSGSDERRTYAMRRLVIVADSSLIVEAIRAGFRDSGEFNLVGRADPRRTSARTILGAEPDVILLDDMAQSERPLQLLEEIRAGDEEIAVILLSIYLDADWLERAFAAGATGVISKATNPVAIATLVRETLNGHIFHPHPAACSATEEPPPAIAAAGQPPLTARELEVLQLVASGATNGDVARQLWVTEQTVKFHLRNIYRKFDVANRTQATHLAHIRGLVSSRVASAASAEPELTIAS